MATQYKQTQNFLLAGLVGGFLITATSFTLAFITKSFDITRHANSQLVLGEWGWVQTINFITFGCLMMVFALGIKRTITGAFGMGLAALVGAYGFASVIVGFNPTDPAFGFPPGTPVEYGGVAAASIQAQIHGISGLIGFSAIVVACFTFAAYFRSVGQKRWMLISLFVGLCVVLVLAYLAVYAGSTITSFNYVPVWVAGTLLWLYVSAVAWRLRQTVAGNT